MFQMNFVGIHWEITGKKVNNFNVLIFFFILFYFILWYFFIFFNDRRKVTFPVLVFYHLVFSFSFVDENKLNFQCKAF